VEGGSAGGEVEGFWGKNITSIIFGTSVRKILFLFKFVLMPGAGDQLLSLSKKIYVCIKCLVF